jgi:hypothetical protein
MCPRKGFLAEVEMQGQRLGFVVAFALVAGCFGASASQAGAAVDSKLTAVFFNDKEFEEPGDTDPVDAFVGTVKSDASTCKKDRTIKLYRGRKVDENLEFLETAKSNAKGKFSVEIEDPGDNFFTVKVTKVRKGEVVCGADSKEVDNGDYEGPVDDDQDDYFTGVGGDCDDNDSNRNPDAVETANFKDDDCDGVGDDMGTSDPDGDGFTSPGDCDDTNSSVKPGATEILDGLDQDCDGLADEIFYTSR